MVQQQIEEAKAMLHPMVTIKLKTLSRFISMPVASFRVATGIAIKLLERSEKWTPPSTNTTWWTLVTLTSRQVTLKQGSKFFVSYPDVAAGKT